MPARPFSPSEVDCIATTLAAAGNYRDRLLLLLGANVGFRISELLSLTVGQLLTSAGEIAREVTIARARLKGGRGVHRRAVRSRRVVLNEPARSAVADYLASLGRMPAAGEFLFLSREGGNRPISRNQAHRVLLQACRASGVDPTRVSTHTLRKSFARAVFEATGHDLLRTQRIVGHSSPLVTARYLESTQAELDDVVLGLQVAASPTSTTQKASDCG